ncbi:transcriptional regulator [Salmonella enterica subsp. enterica]|uniref:Transcriptional regulator n=1 Tax=Salmonella enterica I TaxID=59201 RepID=A0A3S4K7R2_SALET|nr:transcriptional regulator [Salmonella enterica subsp. enterica]
MRLLLAEDNREAGSLAGESAGAKTALPWTAYLTAWRLTIFCTVKCTRWRCWISICREWMDWRWCNGCVNAVRPCPFWLLTARSAVADRVKGLNVGADDYLPKPFELEELDARLRALLRRSAGQVHEVQQLGELIFHDEGYFLLQGQPLALTPREQALLTVLMYRRTRPVSRQQLFEQVFSLNDEVSPESIELYIHRLRKKTSGKAMYELRRCAALGYVLERGDEVGLSRNRCTCNSYCSWGCR